MIYSIGKVIGWISREAAKAQKSLHMCVLGNTTILAEFAGEEEVNRFFAQGQSLGGTTSWQATPGTNQTRMGGTGSGASHPIGHSPHWNNNNNGAGSNSSSGGLGAGGTKQAESCCGVVFSSIPACGDPRVERRDGSWGAPPQSIHCCLGTC
ncbi:trinucleotide repeat-containing gene 6C protein-like [Simochromis diagramma]|uniref:trinucleotide repeat-containing gene 6C protein-like n=1 Tax=Simochromis diagramma TaxID=43689 RepID=UPI001A7EB6B2|nr:trinucleotide repeat-containing gene 6C protein-like [Simochromis diagramma]